MPKDQFNKELCDEKHTEIKTKLAELRKVSYGILFILLASLVKDIATGKEPVTAAKIITGLIGLFS